MSNIMKYIGLFYFDENYIAIIINIAQPLLKPSPYFVHMLPTVHSDVLSVVSQQAEILKLIYMIAWGSFHGGVIYSPDKEQSLTLQTWEPV